MHQPQNYVDAMMANDKFSKWLGLRIVTISEGYCKLTFVVTDDMLNGFDIIHGGVLFAASDSAFAFACNTYGMLTVALSGDVSFVKSATKGEILTVEAQKIHQGKKTGVYEVKTTNSSGELLSLFKGTAYVTARKVIEDGHTHTSPQ
jgi:acyl-CoA thioesterase